MLEGVEEPGEAEGHTEHDALAETTPPHPDYQDNTTPAGDASHLPYPQEEEVDPSEEVGTVQVEEGQVEPSVGEAGFQGEGVAVSEAREDVELQIDPEREAGEETLQIVDKEEQNPEEEKSEAVNPFQDGDLAEQNVEEEGETDEPQLTIDEYDKRSDTEVPEDVEAHEEEEEIDVGTEQDTLAHVPLVQYVLPDEEQDQVMEEEKVEGQVEYENLAEEPAETTDALHQEEQFEDPAIYEENEEPSDISYLEAKGQQNGLPDGQYEEAGESYDLDHPPEEDMEVDDREAEYDINGIDAEDVDEELSPEDLFNIGPSDDRLLPQCRLKRNYSCSHCGFTTQNPREHLYHLRDDHGERMKVFECPRCIYASKNQQKLIRHARMVHKLKIKRRSDSASPHKRQMKSPKVSPLKLPRDNISPGKSSRSSPGKSPRSSESAHDTWDGLEDYDDEDMEGEEESPGKGEEKKYNCEQCEYTCKSRKLLNRHETTYHLKRRFFRCVKCNYVTHLKGRYTKHMKYHQLPILKCEYCDFRTPYRWNLERHMKNHLEDCGEFKCHLCNFSAQIKQSLTVHISNHHLTAEQIRQREMRRTIGISDPADCTSDDQELEMMRMERDEQPEALMMPGFESNPQSPYDATNQNGNNSFRVSNIDMGNQDDALMTAEDGRDEDGEPKKKKPKIKMTLTKMKVPKAKDTFLQEMNERHNFEEDFIHPDDVVHRHGNVYIKTFKCRFCPFKAAFKNEISRHEKKIHSIPMPGVEITAKAKKTMKPSKSYKPSRNEDTINDILQYPHSFSSADKLGKEDESTAEDMTLPIEPSELKVKEEELSNPPSVVNSSGRNSPDIPEDEVEDEQTNEARDLSPCKDGSKKKGQSFFEKLQEKIPTSNVQNLVCQFCGHESKCLSESVRHQKLHLSAKNIYASASLSTRCQFCRHRCKTTDDLIIHLKLCPEARKNQITDSGRRLSGTKVDEHENNGESHVECDEDSKDSSGHHVDGGDEDDDDRHPMENRVFVWNKWNRFQMQEGEEQNSEGSKLKDGTETVVKDIKKLLPDAVGSEELKSGSQEEALDYIESPCPTGSHYYTKRVYRCPQCSFWATTASRFHVHIVGHFNKKPYKCSECGYNSNWRWDITKHIKLKNSKDSSHVSAQVIITDESGEKNYEKYDRYLTIIQLDEPNAHKTEGGISNRKGRPKRTPEKEEEKERESVTPNASPVRKPPMVTIPMMPRLPGLPRLPRLTRAPGPSRSQPGPMPFGPILPGAQMMVQLAGAAAAQAKASQGRPPPPLSLRGATKPTTPTPSTSTPAATPTPSTSTPKSSQKEASPGIGAQYQIITPQGAVSTSLETLQLLASGCTNLSRLKAQHPGDHSPARPPSVSHQVSVSSTGEDGREVARMVLDHKGNPEWKCHSCDFRDSERETVIQHVKLAHARGGPVSLLHAVHRCDVCGYAAGTKRAVQTHIDTSHGGVGGITSRCEGQTPDPKESSDNVEQMEYLDTVRLWRCRRCPFSSKKRSEMRAHAVYHTPRPDCIFKCMLCPYYVPTKGELFEHLNVHGMELPGPVLEAISKAATSPASPFASPFTSPTTQDDVGSKALVCDSCPYETRSRTKLMHHRQFHKPKGLPFRCPHCSYNVTRRHLLSQHIRVHGADKVLDDSMESADINNSDDRSNSPSPSLTITPVNNVAENGGNTGVPDSSLLPKLTDQTTMVLSDIPLVWVSRDNRFFKMFKCRHCPHVNLRKTNIQEHEKMHKTDVARENGGLHCPYCSYVSVNAGVMSAHLKVHAGSMGQCHAVVDPHLSDEDQLRQLTSKPSTSRPETPQAQETSAKEATPKVDEKVIYYCQQCPARFFFEKEIQIHSRFHSTNLPYKCEHCDYGARQQPHLLAHKKVHTPEYQERTRTMMAQHRTANNYPPVPGLSTIHKLEPDVQEKPKEPTSQNKEPATAPTPPTTNVPPQPAPTSKYKCDKCPASFNKLLTLQYHQSLHGANNPHVCKLCNYAGKTCENLQQHELLHTQENGCGDSKVKQEDNDVNSSASSKPDNKDTEVVAKKTNSKNSESNPTLYPPIKLKLVGVRPLSSDGSSGRPHFKYYVEEQIPLSGVDLLKRKHQIEKRGNDSSSTNEFYSSSKNGSKHKTKERDDDNEDDPKRIGDPNLYYPMHIDKVTGKTREKRYKCNKCPSAFEKTEQYNVHTNLHGSNHKYQCRICDYSVKFFANFMMHINRHKFHERMVHQNGGGPPPNDSDPKYEPQVLTAEGSAAVAEKPGKPRLEEANKENLDDVDLTTSERQHLLLQNKKGVKEPSIKDDEKERRVYYCQFCPYANVRRDAVDSHSLRHQGNGGHGVYKCTFCDYTASQPNFIREHTKVHFRPFKYVHPEGFMRHDRQDIVSTVIPVRVEGVNPVSVPEGEQDRFFLFSHNAGLYNPPLPNDDEESESSSQQVGNIQVDFHSGDIVEAPNDFVISLRGSSASKGKHNSGVNDVSETTPEIEQTQGSCTELERAPLDQPKEDGTPGPHVEECREEGMDVDSEQAPVVTVEEQVASQENHAENGEPMEVSHIESTTQKSFIAKPSSIVSSH